MNKDDLFKFLDDDGPTEEDYKPLRSPFGYPGNKFRSLDQILPRLPYYDNYVEVFGGTGSVLLNRKPSKFEVFNDRHSGIVAFYYCVQDSKLLDQLIEKVKLTVHAREFWLWCHNTWEKQEDVVDRAFRWYYTIRYSFAQKGDAFGRLKKGGIVAGRITSALPDFWTIHDRLKRVQIENMDWLRCLRDYDSSNTVFYLDPPYIDRPVYKGGNIDHKKLLATIFDMEGYVALSGYSSDMYDQLPWDEVHEWQVNDQIAAMGTNELSRSGAMNNLRTKVKERLWIKYET